MTTRSFDHRRLATVPLFRGLDDAACRAVMALARPRRVDAGGAVFEQGDPANAFFVLAEGRLKIVQTAASGQQVIMHFVHPGEFFGCVALMGGARYPGSARALERSTALGWTPADAQRLIQEHPIVASNALSGFGSRVLGLNARLREIHTEPADRRIAHALLRLAGRVGTDSRAGIRLSITRQELAEIAGTTLHTASRTVSRWARDGILKGGRKRIMIADLPGLEAMVAED